MEITTNGGNMTTKTARAEQIYTELKLMDRMTPGRTPWQTLRKRAEELASAEAILDDLPAMGDKELAHALCAAELADDTETTTFVQNEVCARLALPLDETELGLTQHASDMLDGFIRENADSDVSTNFFAAK
jgi:hypothetical protein